MKKFLNILPDLKLSHEMTELFETVECEKVAASRDHSRIKIYIHSDRLIAHKAIRETERAIRSQMFKDQVDVCLVEKYHLSRQYTPARTFCQSFQKGRENISGTFCSGVEGGRKLHCAGENGEVEA